MICLGERGKVTRNLFNYSSGRIVSVGSVLLKPMWAPSTHFSWYTNIYLPARNYRHYININKKDYLIVCFTHTRHEVTLLFFILTLVRVCLSGCRSCWADFTPSKISYPPVKVRSKSTELFSKVLVPRTNKWANRQKSTKNVFFHRYAFIEKSFIITIRHLNFIYLYLHKKMDSWNIFT